MTAAARCVTSSVIANSPQTARAPAGYSQGRAFGALMRRFDDIIGFVLIATPTTALICHLFIHLTGGY